MIIESLQFSHIYMADGTVKYSVDFRPFNGDKIENVFDDEQLAKDAYNAIIDNLESGAWDIVDKDRKPILKPFFTRL